MPELPDVEFFRRYIDRTALNRPIRRVHAPRGKALKTTPRKLGQALTARRLSASRRHGKYLFLQIHHGPWLVLHFGMTGFPRFLHDPDAEPPPHVRLLLTFEDDTRLAYDDQRMLGRIDLADDPQRFAARKSLGPDLLDLDLATFRHILASRRGTIKAALMNQNLMAGIGNVYSDEILFQAGLHPRRTPAELDGEHVKHLHRTALRVLHKAVDFQADPRRAPRDFLLARRHDDHPACPRCSRRLQSEKISGRTAYYCPSCQS